MNKGFTLVELIAVVTILGLLAIITTPAYDSISNNIKSQNYNSKKSTIKSQTLSYVEKYLKDKVYDGKKVDVNGNKISNYYCFTVEYLIQNGIISSDDEEDEYIENNVTGDKYRGNHEYVKVYYDNDKLKLIALVNDELTNEKTGYNKNICTHCDNEEGECSA